jgi:hypothetical protein
MIFDFLGHSDLLQDPDSLEIRMRHDSLELLQDFALTVYVGFP